MGDVAVVLVRAAAPGESLEAALGAAGVEALARLRARRLRAWVTASFPGVEPRELDGGFGDAVAAAAAGVSRGGVASPGVSPSGVAPLGVAPLGVPPPGAPPPGVSSSGAPSGAASRDIVVVLAPELAAWRPGLGAAALQDVRSGCALSFGPVFDGGLYLLAISTSALPGLAGLDGLDLDGPGAMAGIVELAGHSGFEVGMLRTERGLRGAGDVRATLVDPLCDDELRSVLQ